MKDNKKENVKYEQSAMAVVLFDGKILCTVEDIYGKKVLSLPKGHVEVGETVLEAAIRECFEETDVILTANDAVEQLEPYSYSFTTPQGQQICKTLYPVLFYLSKKQAPLAKETRICEVRFMDMADFLRNCSYDNIRNLVRKILL